jgi:hypothetical protein
LNKGPGHKSDIVKFKESASVLTGITGIFLDGVKQDDWISGMAGSFFGLRGITGIGFVAIMLL